MVTFFNVFVVVMESNVDVEILVMYLTGRRHLSPSFLDNNRLDH